MYYPFNPRKLNTSHEEICRFNSFNRLITTCQPGWFKNETITFKEHTMPVSFFNTFTDIGKIQRIKQNIPSPRKIK